MSQNYCVHCGRSSPDRFNVSRGQVFSSTEENSGSRVPLTPTDTDINNKNNCFQNLFGQCFGSYKPDSVDASENNSEPPTSVSSQYRRRESTLPVYEKYLAETAQVASNENNMDASEKDESTDDFNENIKNTTIATNSVPQPRRSFFKKPLSLQLSVNNNSVRKIISRSPVSSSPDYSTQKYIEWNESDVFNTAAGFQFPYNRKKGPEEGKYGLLLPPNQGPLKLLLVFAREDSVSDALWRSAERIGFEVSQARDHETALDDFFACSHDLVIIDTRVAKHFDADTLCRSIRNTKGSQHTVVVAVVRRSVMEKDECIIAQLLESGFNRCIVESSHMNVCVNELLQLKSSEVRPYAQFTTTQALYAALDKCHDIVHVTDCTHRIQYTNNTSECIIGYRQDEIIGKSLLDQFLTNLETLQAMNQTLQRAHEWHSTMTIKRKNGEYLTTTCHVIPICCAGRAPTHYVFVQNTQGALPPITPTTDSVACLPNPHSNAAPNISERPRGSVHSLRRGSFDIRSIGSDGIRRTSIAKLHSLPLEAPITKAISLIANIQDQVSPTQSQILDKVIDLIRTNELYSPQMKEDHRVRSDDPVTSDLIGALLTQNSMQISSSRRSSNDSSVVRQSQSRLSSTNRHRVPVLLRDLLDTSLQWEFDIFKLEDITNKKPLVHLGMNLMCHFDVTGTLNCDEKTLHNWLTIIESKYRSSNTYHNSTHAADVLQATAGYLEKERMKAIMDPLDEATSLIAAAAHDLDHPGKSSAFLCNSDNPLAILYNDLTVLESHHAALMFKLTLSDERWNIFKNLDREQYKIARHNVIDMILATEMTKHFEHLAKFVNVFCTRSLGREETLYSSDADSTDLSVLNLPENITLVKRMMIKCADVSNPTRPMSLCVEWARRIAEEYFLQTDEEKSKNLPVVMPMFDRTTCSIPKSQIGFVDYIINDMMEAWDAFIDMPELVTYMRQNYLLWKDYDEQGIKSLEDIKNIQGAS